MKKFTLLLVALIIVLGISSSANAQDAKAFYSTGVKFLKANNLSDALTYFTKAIDAKPQYIDAYKMRAEVYEMQNKIQNALEDYERVLTLAPKDATVYSNASHLYLVNGENQKAYDYAVKALSFSPKSLPALQNKVAAMIAMKKYYDAWTDCEKAIKISKKDAVTYYQMGIIQYNLENFTTAEEAFGLAIRYNPNYEEAYEAMIRNYIKMNKLVDAINVGNIGIERFPKSEIIYIARSEAFKLKFDFPAAINDLSKVLVFNPNNAKVYIMRGSYYQEFNQHQYAINDFSKAISLNDTCYMAYFKRAKSYEEIMDIKSAIKDYQKLLSFNKYDPTINLLMDQTKKRLFEINRESNKPEIAIIEPKTLNDTTIVIPLNAKEAVLKGKITDENKIASVIVNGAKLPYNIDTTNNEFSVKIDLSSSNFITVSASDIYNNTQSIKYSITRTEITPPEISIMAPYASDNGHIYLETNDANIYIEGKIKDENLIKSITVENNTASWPTDQLNPSFSATINITNKSTIKVKATDIYGNVSEREFVLNREGVTLLEENPMGKTWVIFIENSQYQTFASIDGPKKDVSLMKAALANYKIHNFIHKENMSKVQLERFFSIELRDLVRGNQVNSILVWYAGHGKFINETGYWIPTDAKRDDEFTYFNINNLKASLQTYSKTMTHTLIISDACESGPSFYQAMRSAIKERDCSDWKATRFKSSQVFSSAGYELAIDNSQFTRTFANTLSVNPNQCIPIENIVIKVTKAVTETNKQTPKFGKISGMIDEDGTFFFIRK